ncbi:MAG: ribonuclease / adenosylcobalamin/alpha-ribazole phosphatase [Frankiales bacterium]|nr:ribonuclease / adenosylcobalamin/alpha-ribazole phosphatase [Frankiales bacterium]
MTLFDSTAPGLRVAIEADGGSRGNPGPAGYGAVVLSPAGEVLAEAAEAIGRATNNVAEYRGLIAGLDAALALGATQVDVRMDSKLVVEQMSGRWQIKHPDMKPLALQAKSLVRQFDKVSFAWIPRERNKHADRLANEAMDDAAAGRTWSRRVLSAGADSPVEVATTPMRTASLEPPTTLVLLRHGETRMSVEKRFSGPTAEPLTARGEAMAEAAAARLAARRSSPIEAIVCSPVARAVATAAPVAAALDLDVIVDDGLREVDFGDWDGYTFAEVQAKWPAEMAAWLSDADVAPPHGESMAGCGRRVRQSRDRILAAHPSRTVLVVSHVTPIKTLVRIALDAPVAALFRMHLDLASLSEIAWYADGPATLRSYNETFHLEGLET